MEYSGDTFGGYKLRQIEEVLLDMQGVLTQLRYAITRLDHKVDVLARGMTTEETLAAITALNTDAARIEAATDALGNATTKLDSTGV